MIDAGAGRATKGVRRIAFAIDDPGAAGAGVASPAGAELVGGMERYEDSHRRGYVPGPEGIIVMLAKQIGLSAPPGRQPPCQCQCSSQTESSSGACESGGAARCIVPGSGTDLTVSVASPSCVGGSTGWFRLTTSRAPSRLSKLAPCCGTVSPW